MMRLPRGEDGWSRLPAATILSTASLLALGACKEEHPSAEAPAPVRVEQIAFEQTAEARSYTGVVRARYETDLGFRVAGKIVERLVNVGDHVAKDQVLARLDPSDYRLAVESTLADLAAAKSSLAQAAAEERRSGKLVAQGWVSPSSYDLKKAAADEAQGRVERTERALETARNQVAYTELRANEAGIITTLPVEVGQVVAVGQLVARLAQLAQREVVVAIPESRLDDARSSDATVDLWADGSRRYKALLREFSPQADPATRTYQARFTIEAADDAVVLGMTATVRLALKESRPAVRVRPLDQRQQRHHHRQEPHAAQPDRHRGFERRRAGAERRDQNHLRGPGPHQQGRQQHPGEAEAIVMAERPHPHIGADQHQAEDGGRGRPESGKRARRARGRSLIHRRLGRHGGNRRQSPKAWLRGRRGLLLHRGNNEGSPRAGLSHAANAELERAFGREITGSASDQSRSDEVRLAKTGQSRARPRIGTHFVSINLSSKLICPSASNTKAVAAFRAINAENA